MHTYFIFIKEIKDFWLDLIIEFPCIEEYNFNQHKAL